ncbi:MAG: EAL domain-containing protein, partial [Janthinobacterium lividum]
MVDHPEQARLQALRELNVLDTDPSEMFDRITRMAAQLFQLPIAAVSLTDVDRQWFKSRVGVNHVSIARDKAPCAQVTESAGTLVIADLHKDACYQDSPLARSGIRFYAGVPLKTRSGFVLGAMCVLGLEPRQILPGEMDFLSDLAAMVMEQIELQHAFKHVDPLSGLSNRRQLVEDMEDLASDLPLRERRHLVIIDLASAQQLSDATRVMGSSYLDEMVKEAARAMTSGNGSSRKTYHIAPTQFAFLAPAGVKENDYVARLNSQLEQVRNSELYRVVATTVIGIAPFKVGQDTPDAILRTAQSAVQDARLSGNRVSLYSSVQDAAQQRRFALRHEFGKALEATDQLRLVYQPRVHIGSGRCVGAEALLRWRHPTIGNISPGEFIPIVEQTWLTRATTIWVMNAALDQLASWHRIGIDIPLSINVSAANLTESDFLERMIDGLASR